MNNSYTNNSLYFLLFYANGLKIHINELQTRCYVNYLDQNFFNSILVEFKNRYMGKKITNIKYLVYKYLFLELNNELR
jgi:hypothetical protein